ncbi:hypothetical protein B0H63DRAFT_313485 [Podospora didyma]|uniref:Secreted protein n=1 Tax=Podospora didyma TaxID=330526 RepID=A0AAE0N4T8_9PEZI|nr:hypothetical protein B0H63DRAFT_313485 [Podospora didyma]
MRWTAVFWLDSSSTWASLAPSTMVSVTVTCIHNTHHPSPIRVGPIARSRAKLTTIAVQGISQVTSSSLQKDKICKPPIHRSINHLARQPFVCCDCGCRTGTTRPNHPSLPTDATQCDVNANAAVKRKECKMQ